MNLLKINLLKNILLKNISLAKIILLFTLIFLSLNIFAFASASTDLFKNSRSIVPSNSGGYVKLQLDSEIYKRMLNPIQDLRIYDSKNNEVPYFSNSEYQYFRQSNLNAAIMNNVISNNGTQLELTFSTLSKAITELNFNIDAPNDYILEPEILGSDDKKNWSQIKTSSFLYRIRSKNIQVSNTISISPTSFRFLKINLKNIVGKVYPMNIYSVYYSPTNLTTDSFSKNENVAILGTTSEGEKSIITIDNGYTNAPIDRIKFNVENKDFARMVALFGSNDKEKWQLITSQTEIYSINVQKTNISKNYIDTKGNNFRYLKAHFLDKDSEPLKITSIDTLYYPDYIIFNSMPAEKYTTYFGSRNVSPPEYNSSKLQEYMDISTLANTSWEVDIITNPLYKGVDLDTEQSSTLITIFIIIMVIVLSGFILKSLKHIKSQ